MYVVFDWKHIYKYIDVWIDVDCRKYTCEWLKLCLCVHDDINRLCCIKIGCELVNLFRLDVDYTELWFVLVNWGVYWLYSLIDWRISMLLTDIWLKWDKLTVRTLRERTLYFEVTERWIEWNEGKIVSFYWDVCLVGVPRDHQLILHLREH